jgi:hypothetical protein
VAEEIDQIDLDLSQMVAEEPTVWDFSDLGARAERAANRVDTAVERGRARELLRKIARFEDIQERYLRVVDVRVDTDRRNQQLVAGSRAYRDQYRSEIGPISTARTIDTLPSADQKSGYDGVGRLMQVVSRGSGTPQYALLDKSGAVRFYVTPAPGVNLQKYLGREVGISGAVGYLPNESAQHVTAKRIESVWQSKLR